MKKIKGFQQPDPKGNDMLRSENGPWRLYQRGPSYRIGRKVWWGIKWLKDRSPRAGLFIFQTQHLPDARTELKTMNEEAYDKNWYKVNKWEVRK